MSIQEISVSNSQKKKLLRAEQLEPVLFQDENGDLVISVEAYQTLKVERGLELLEELIGHEKLDFEVEYFVFN